MNGRSGLVLQGDCCWVTRSFFRRARWPGSTRKPRTRRMRGSKLVPKYRKGVPVAGRTKESRSTATGPSRCATPVARWSRTASLRTRCFHYKEPCYWPWPLAARTPSVGGRFYLLLLRTKRWRPAPRPLEGRLVKFLNLEPGELMVQVIITFSITYWLVLVPVAPWSFQELPWQARQGA